MFMCMSQCIQNVSLFDEIPPTRWHYVYISKQLYLMCTQAPWPHGQSPVFVFEYYIVDVGCLINERRRLRKIGELSHRSLMLNLVEKKIPQANRANRLHWGCNRGLFI